MTKWPIGTHVIYTRGKYKFPGEVTMSDSDGGVVVKAFGDMEGNYSGMKHIYNEEVLEPYIWQGDQLGIAPLIIFVDDNPVFKMREWLAKFQGRPDARKLQGFAAIRAIIDNLDQLLAAPVVLNHTCNECRGSGWVGHGMGGDTCGTCGGTGQTHG